jgi:hypothetical protein
MAGPITPVNTPATHAVQSTASDRQTEQQVQVVEQHQPDTDPACAEELLKAQGTLAGFQICVNAATNVVAVDRDNALAIERNFDSPMA